MYIPPRVRAELYRHVCVVLFCGMTVVLCTRFAALDLSDQALVDKHFGVLRQNKAIEILRRCLARVATTSAAATTTLHYYLSLPPAG